MSLGLRIVRYIILEAQKRGLKQRLQDQAWEEAAAFIRANWSRDCEFFEDWWMLREHAIKQAKYSGLYLEFGVFSGKTINFYSGYN